MDKSRRHLTLILLRPDGRNQTWAFTRRKIIWLSVGATVLMTAIAVLISAAILQRIEYKRLWDKYQLMAGREIVALSPQPVGVDQVPGAAELTQQEQQLIGTAQATQSVETSVAQEESPLSTEAVVRFDNFMLRPIEGDNQWELSVQLTKIEWTNEVQGGFIAILIEDAYRTGRYLTFPPMTIVNGRPLSPQTGEPFSIRRLKPIRYEFPLPEDFQMREVQILAYDTQGNLLLERVFPADH